MKAGMGISTAVLAFLLLPAALPALDIRVAPLLYVDETADMARDTGKAQGDLLRALWSVETGAALNFSGLKDNRVNPPESLADAVTICRGEKIDYLLYGYVAKRAYNLAGEIRLFDYANRQVVRSFYGMDDAEHYDRLMDDLAGKILQHIGETYNLKITLEKTAAARILVPAAAGYWTPMSGDWTNLMLGAVQAVSGFAFVPSDNVFVWRGLSWYFSTGLEAKYRLGVGNPASYESYYHNLCLTLPARAHVALSPRHQAFAGVGCTYFLEFLNIANKYEDSETFVYNNMGLNLCLGYEFALSRRLGLFFRNDFDFLFNRKSLISYAPVIGLNIQVYSKEISRKW